MFLGIDTSNYTTSVAMLHGDNCIDRRIALCVPDGMVGLRQSDAHFQHVKNLPGLIKQMGSLRSLNAIAVSDRPRSVTGSYMPCFTAGVSFAESLSAALGIPCYAASHQQGHLAAVLYSCKREDLFDKSFCAWHVSGGTTELLKVGPMLDAERIGGSSDSSAGQIIDRVGRLLGLPFPAGPAMEALANEHTKVLKGKLTVRNSEFSLSGLENQAKRFKEEGETHSDIAFYILKSIADAIEKASAERPYNALVCCGGVMGNNYIKSRFTEAIWAETAVSSDNAVGVAFLAKTLFEREVGN